MCTWNSNPDKIRELREGAPVVTAYKAVMTRGKKLKSSGNDWVWEQGWQVAQGDPVDWLHDATQIAAYKQTGIYPYNGQAHGGGFHVSLSLKDAKAWCEEGSRCNVVIKVLVDPKDIFALGYPNSNTERTDMAVRRCWVESTVPVWRRPSREVLRERARKAKAKLAAKLKTKKKRKK